MEQQRLWTLLGKQLAGAATEEELQELELLLVAYDEDPRTIAILQHLWTNRIPANNNKNPNPNKTPNNNEDPNTHNNPDTNEITNETSNAIRRRIDQALGWPILPEPTSKKPTRKTLWLATAITTAAAAAAIILTIFLLPPKKQDTMSVLSTKKRSHSNLQFPDGTTVVLNENSRLYYNTDFGKQRREIILEGEAYFDVAGDPNIPLIIHARNIDIRVLGTSFNVKAYTKDPEVETSLIKGAVELTIKNHPEHRLLLKPNEKLAIPAASTNLPNKNTPKNPTEKPEYHLQTLQTEQSSRLIPEIAWIYRKLVFNQEPFASVAQKMETWYDVKFHFEEEDDDLKKEVFTGSFSKESLQEALKALQYSYHFQFTIKDKEVFIRKD